MKITDYLWIYFSLVLSKGVHPGKINQLLIPEVVQSGSSAILTCYYSASDECSVQWFFNQSRNPVFDWSPNVEPKISEILEGRMGTAAILLPNEGQHSLRISNATPDLSGEYMCRVCSNIADSEDAHLSKSMLIFSPEKEFELKLVKVNNEVEITCAVHGVHPLPELTITYNGETVQKQHQRVWREQSLYDAVSVARIPASMAMPITCRLLLPLAGYTAMKMDSLRFDEDKLVNGTSSASAPNFTLLWIKLLLAHFFCELKRRLAENNLLK